MAFYLLFSGGYLAHSLAIMTDAAHLFTDFCSMMVSLFSLWLSSRPPTKTMNFGWYRSGKHYEIDAKHLRLDFVKLFYCHLIVVYNTNNCISMIIITLCVFTEILGALISVISIWIVTGVLVYLAFERILKNDYEIQGQVMLLTSGCAVVVNIM